MSLIQEIGAYAGLAAIPGLAILSALYFSQARDVRRLREWAGRAPERAAEQASGGRVAAQQVATGTQAAPAAQPAGAAAAGAQPASAAAAQPAATAPAAQPAVAGAPANAVAAAGGAAVAAGAAPAATGATAAEATAPAEPATASAGTATPEKVAAGNSGGAATGTGTVTKPATAGAKAATGGGAPPTTGAKPAGTGARPASTTTAAAGTGIRRPGAPRIPSQQTSILKPSSAAAPPSEPWYRRLAARLPAARYLALIVAGVLVVGGGAAFGITQLAKEGNSSAPERAPAADVPREDEQQEVSLRPENITVTVLNGTQINGLARDTATRLEQLGFMIANTLTATETAQAESVVQFTEEPGASQQAKYVAAKLDISQIEPADQESLDQAGSATVIVVLGADQAPPAQ